MLSVVSNAAPKVKANPAIDPNYSCAPSLTANCEMSADFTLTLTGLDPKKSYLVSGMSNSYGETIDVGGAILNPSTDTLTVTDELGSLAGTWTFTLYEVNAHNGNVGKAYDSVTISFD